jgi:hypothetical protein
MRRWLEQLPKSWIFGLWYIFGFLAYRFLRHRPFPVWGDLPAYLETYVGFVIGSATVFWWRERRRSQEKR